MEKGRWNSIWHQLDEIIRLQPRRVLEIGPGIGLFKRAAGLYGVPVETLDIDPELKPDHVASFTELPFADGEFDVVCAFQMLEHVPYDVSLAALAELSRVENRDDRQRVVKGTSGSVRVALGGCRIIKKKT